MKLARGLVFLAVIPAGCGGPAVHVKAAPPPALPGGWTQGADAADGMTIGLPSGWRVGADTALDPMGLAQGVAGDAGQTNVDPDNPVAKMQNEMEESQRKDEQEELARLREKGIVLQAIDGSRPTIGEERTRYFVKKVEHSGNCSLDVAGNEEQEAMRGNGMGEPKKVDLPIGPALRFEGDTKTRGGDEITHISFVVVDGKNSYSLRFGATNSPQAIQSIADDVAKSWRIAPGKP